MKDADLRSMSVDELWQLYEKVRATLASRLAEEKALLEKRLLQLKSSDLNGGPQRARRPYPQVFPKYRNPAQPGETWSGRGKQPLWLAALLRSGKKLDDFRIKPVSAGILRSRRSRKVGRAQSSA